jgi:hypothetical protein
MQHQTLILPHNWRKKVSETLEAEGVALNGQQVYDILRGRTKNPVLLKKVKKAQKKVAESHARQLQQLQALTAIFFITFWLF